MQADAGARRTRKWAMKKKRRKTKKAKRKAKSKKQCR